MDHQTRKTLYGLKDADMTRSEKLMGGLEAMNLVQSKVDSCVWYKEEMVLLFYVYYWLMFSNSKDKSAEVHASIQAYFKI